ncbi:AfsR/SARP family transcriptional regulator [Nocardia takedensis]|uniref:AfsR/SARP family transcriptional regulator n=1 Tax=Nocardia takedensis TaxID=259390 RepID=UPI0007C5CA79|nr:AfsR/SARP family transcriptional regulator [Nocardia takedensis]
MTDVFHRRYEILGPLRIVNDEQSAAFVSISARKVATLLATLLVRADQVISLDELISELWLDRPPRRVGATLHVYISQLRKLLKQPDRPESPIITRSSGYMLRLENDRIDVQDMRRLMQEGYNFARAGKHQVAARYFAEALNLWRAPALSELRDGPILQNVTNWLDGVEIECAEMLNHAELVLGQYNTVAGRLHQLVAEHPLNEAFAGQYMFALTRSGRRAAALEVYRNIRNTLNRELGLEPGEELQAIHKEALDGSSRLGWGEMLGKRLVHEGF